MTNQNDKNDKNDKNIKENNIKENNVNLDEELQPWRTQIDDIDQTILKLLNQRAELAIKIGEVKHQHGSPIFKPEREQKVMQGLAEINSGPILNESIYHIWREIMAAARLLEDKQTVAFLGPAGTFSELAMQKYFGHGVIGVPQASIDAVFQTIDQKKTHFAVVPIENSTEGSVNRTLDLLIHTNAAVIGEVSIPVQHCLLSKNIELSKDQTYIVCGHPQALAQCQTYLQSHPVLQYSERQALASNALAAEMAKNNPQYIAIASEACAKTYELQVLDHEIQDEYHNRTRFAVLGYHETFANLNEPSADQTSFILAVPNQAGAILKVLQPLAHYGVSMCRLESRPAKKSFSWEYIFMIDVEGHVQTQNVAQALEEIKSHSEFFKFLGSYAKAL